MTAALQTVIDNAWDKRESLSLSTQGTERDAVNQALARLDNGTARVAEKKDGH